MKNMTCGGHRLFDLKQKKGLSGELFCCICLKKPSKEIYSMP
jgi:hypothetical protein